jgi:hypothetical protein
MQPAATLLPQLTLILRALAALVAARFLRDPTRIALIVPLWRRLTRAATRLETVFARLAAGHAPKPRTPHKGGAHKNPPLPGGHAWLIRALGPEAAAYAAQLDALLATPEAAPLLATPQAGRILNPIRRMLGLATPAKPRAPKQPAPRRQPPPPVAFPPTLDPPSQRRPWWLPPPHLRSG